MVPEKGVPKALTENEVSELTMGHLGHVFQRIVSPNRADSLIGYMLKAVNRDRIGVAHRISHARAEKRLRQNVGPYMWSPTNATQEVVSEHDLTSRGGRAASGWPINWLLHLILLDCIASSGDIPLP